MLRQVTESHISHVQIHFPQKQPLHPCTGLAAVLQMFYSRAHCCACSCPSLDHHHPAGTFQAQVASGKVEMQSLMLRAEVHCHPLHGPAEWSSLHCQVPALCRECTSFMSSSNSELTRLRGTAPGLPRKPRFLTAELPHPNSMCFSYPGFPPTAQLEFV